MERIKNFLKKRRWYVLCLLLLYFALTREPVGTALTNSSLWGEIEERTFVPRAILMGGYAAVQVFLASRRHSDINAYNAVMRELSREERRFIYAEDPERVRILRNVFPEFRQFTDTANSRETIELRVTPTRIRPGQTVRLEAIPSSETPDLGSWILAGPRASLGRRWLRNRYRGTFRSGALETGKFTFRVMTTVGHHSNSVTIVVEPDYRRLSRIFLSAMGMLQRENPRISVQEGYTTQPTLFAETRRGRRIVLSTPGLDVHWTVDDDSVAKITHNDGSIVLKGLARGSTTLRAVYGTLRAEAPVRVSPPSPRRLGGPPEPPPAEPPRPIKPLDGFVGRVGERIHLEATSFDISKGHIFHGSNWGVYWIDPETGRRCRRMAGLGFGNSERAEWIPRRAGIYEWEVTYSYNTVHRRPYSRVTSLPQRIVIVE